MGQRILEPWKRTTSPISSADVFSRCTINLGPGLLESAYEAALGLELMNAGVQVKVQVALPMIYQTIKWMSGIDWMWWSRTK